MLHFRINAITLQGKAAAIMRGLVIHRRTHGRFSIGVKVDEDQLQVVPVHSLLERRDLVQVAQVLQDKQKSDRETKTMWDCSSEATHVDDVGEIGERLRVARPLEDIKADELMKQANVGLGDGITQ